MTDVLDTVKTLLTDNWNSSNTDSLTPTIYFASESKSHNTANADQISLYEVTELPKPHGIGGQDFETKSVVAIDVKTTYKVTSLSNIRPHLDKLKVEIRRIIRENINSPGTGYKYVVETEKKDLSDKRIGKGRLVFTVELTEWETI